MVRIALVVSLVVTSVASAQPSPSLVRADVTGAPDAEKLAGSVLVWIDATLYMAPKADAQTIQLAKLPTRKERIASAIPMRVIATHGAFVEVEQADTNKNSCVWFKLESKELRKTRLFVKRADLAPVVTRKHEVTLDDGSRIAVSPGHAIERLVDGRVMVQLWGNSIPAPLPATAIGYSYPMAKSSAAATRDKFELTARQITVGGTEIAIRPPELAPKIERKDGKVLFPIDGSCMSVMAVVAESDVRAYKPPTLERGSQGGAFVQLMTGDTHGPERWYVPAGTKLTVENGHATAVANEELEVAKPTKGDALACGKATLGARTFFQIKPPIQVSSSELRVCAPVKLVKHRAASDDPFVGGRRPGSDLEEQLKAVK